MRSLLVLCLLSLAACGEQPYTVSWMCSGEPEVGTWSNGSGQTIKIQENCRAVAGDNVLKYEKQDGKIIFTQEHGNTILNPATCDLTVSDTSMTILCPDHTYDNVLGTNFTKQ